MSLGILEIIETQADSAPGFVWAIDAANEYEPITALQLHARAIRLSHSLEQRGVGRGSWCAADMGTCAGFLYLVLAAAYGGFAITALNTRLTEAEKADRLHDMASGIDVDSLLCIDEQCVLDMVRGSDGPSAAQARWAQDAVAAFDGTAPAVAMFTSGTSGSPKAAVLSWDNLTGAATASNRLLSEEGHGLWQLTLPMYHVGGLEIVFRSILNRNPFILYRRFDACTVLRDAAKYGATHVSVVDKMLQDLLAAKDAGVLAAYRCVLLGGAAPNARTLARALDAHAHIYAGYGMTETCSQAASRSVRSGAGEGLLPLPGYRFKVVGPSADGAGLLAVAGPGVFGGYANASAAFTDDGYFLTGDRARIADGLIYVAERSNDMFVSGGENVYPEEIRKKILDIPGVTDAYVLGVSDDRWGRRPVALVEAPDVSHETGFCPAIMADDVRAALALRLSKVYLPDRIMVLPEFPRTGIGKQDRRALRGVYENRLEAVRVDIWVVGQPLCKEIRTAKVRLNRRDSIIVRIEDRVGRTGIGEDTAFSTDWYLPETIDDDLPVLKELLIPAVLGRSFAHPSQARAVFGRIPGAHTHPLACAAIENALWDLYGKTVGASLRQLIANAADAGNAESACIVGAGRVRGGATVGIASLAQTMAAVDDAVACGYTRVKMKIAPGHDVDLVRAVRAAHPNLIIMVDANQSYCEDDLAVLEQLDACGIACIEEPLDPRRAPASGPSDLFERLARLQGKLKAPVCIDESWTSVGQLRTALQENPALRCVAMKLGKFGGVQPAIDFYRWARSHGIELWMGGMYDTGVSKRLHAAFAALPGMDLPGDICDASRYFERDITDPPFALRGGSIETNSAGHASGLGCDLADDVVEGLAISHFSYSMHGFPPAGAEYARN
jgi:O-succinylbenzoate synthase